MRRDVGRTRMRSRDPRGAGPRGGLEIAPRYRGSGTAVWVGLGPSVRGAAARDVSTLLVRWTQRARGGRRQRRVQRPTGHAHGFRAHGVGFDWDIRTAILCRRGGRRAAAGRRFIKAQL